MDQNKKMVEAITPMDEDFAKWYTDIVRKADLADYSSVRGCMIVRPYGTAIWENIRNLLDGMFKETGHENVMMPLFIPESLLQKEKDHVAGFAPEVAWVTHGGNEELAERLCVRPTSETLFCEHFAKVVNSYRDLPLLYNQWCSVVRWEKTTRPFLRTTEFWWQEGHTLHETADEAMAETRQMLDIYARLCEEYLSIPVIKGNKTDKEKFAGAELTMSIEAMMHDGKALQSGTSHYFGDGFSRAFDVQFTGRNNTLEYPHETSWGLSTRIIGAIIMTHGDDNGLVLPPAIAPVQVVIIPVAQHKPGVLDKAFELKQRLGAFCRVKVDDSDHQPGWKYSEQEMRGIPLRLEIGPRDIEQNQCILVTRLDREKHIVSLDELETKIPELLGQISAGLYEKALARQKSMTYQAGTYEEIADLAQNKPGFIESMWCGDLACEMKLKDELGLSSRCMPFEEVPIGDTCPICGKPAKTMIIWGKSY